MKKLTYLLIALVAICFGPFITSLEVAGDPQEPEYYCDYCDPQHQNAWVGLPGFFDYAAHMMGHEENIFVCPLENPEFPGYPCGAYFGSPSDLMTHKQNDH
jgi:hypothetical protein